MENCSWTKQKVCSKCLANNGSIYCVITFVILDIDLTFALTIKIRRDRGGGGGGGGADGKGGRKRGERDGREKGVRERKREGERNRHTDGERLERRREEGKRGKGRGGEPETEIYVCMRTCAYVNGGNNYHRTIITVCVVCRVHVCMCSYVGASVYIVYCINPQYQL